MRKIIIEVPDDCIKCRYRDYNQCKLFNATIDLGDDFNDWERLPACIAAEVDNLFNKHLENVLKEEKGDK